MQIIGHLGRDAEVKVMGIESVINFSVAHTDKWSDANGIKKERTTWVSCSWWVEKSTIAQYLKKGTQIWAEGIPEAKIWKKDGEPQPFLNLRVLNVQLLGGGNNTSQNQSDNKNNIAEKPTSNDTGYKSINTSDDDLPF